MPRPRSTAHGRRQADERRRGSVLVPLAEQGVLDLLVHAVEDAVVPVEATARFGDRAEQREQDRVVQRALLVRLRAGVGAGEDRSGRLALELLDRGRGVVEPEEPVGARIDVAARQRPELVERRVAGRRVLLEGERERRVVLGLAVEVRERAEAKAAHGSVEVGRAHSHGIAYAPRGSSPL